MFANGTQLWKIDNPAGNGRVWADVVIANVDGVGGLEVVICFSQGWVGVFDLATGAPKPGSPRQIIANGREFRALSVADMDGDGPCEIAIGLADSTYAGALHYVPCAPDVFRAAQTRCTCWTRR